MGHLLLAQDLLLDPTKVAEELSKAQSVQQVLATVVGVLLLFLLATVVFHIREARRWEEKHDTMVGKNFKTFRRVERAISALAGLGDSYSDADEEE